VENVTRFLFGTLTLILLTSVLLEKEHMRASALGEQSVSHNILYIFGQN
jgi:hypothetical protein